jgi:hypothetical protein
VGSGTNLDLKGVTGERVVLVEEVGGRFAAIDIQKRSVYCAFVREGERGLERDWPKTVNVSRARAAQRAMMTNRSFQEGGTDIFIGCKGVFDEKCGRRETNRVRSAG